jgi:5-methylcytosine-specific restriction endonuclease McrA
MYVDRRWIDSEEKIRIKIALWKRSSLCSLCDLPMLPTFYIDGSPKIEQDVYKSRIIPTVDHIVERRNGGNNEISNLRLAHKFCNAIRENSPNPKNHRKWYTLVLQELYFHNLIDEKTYLSYKEQLKVIG